jgi:1-acyl-sn-glycerol-3-phosphate acyltransferase
MLYYFVKNTAWFIYKLLFNITVVGLENVPKDGGLVICANHRTNHDPVVVAASQKRQVSFMAKEELLKLPIIGFVLLKIGVFPVKRGSGDIGAVRKAVEIIKNGGVLSVFPEGTRNKTKDLLIEFKTGAALIAYRANADIQPCAIIGSYKLFSKVTIIYGNPIYLKKFGEKPSLELITNDIKKEILRIFDEYNKKTS